MNHRYTLQRNWLGAGGILNWIMLNPSTADDVFDDPTIRKCIGFSKRWGFAGLTVTNLFGYRATDPAELKKLNRGLAIGVSNDINIENEARLARTVVCAWGDHGTWLARDTEVCRLLSSRALFCIGRTRGGNPLHPSRCGYTNRPVLYRAAIGDPA